MIVVKNSDLNNDTIKILNDLIDLDISASSAFRLSRIIKAISSIFEDKVKAEKRILDKYVLRDENGTPLHPKDDQGNDIKTSLSISNMELFTKEMSELMDVENNIPFDKINFDDLRLDVAKIKNIIKIDFLFI